MHIFCDAYMDLCACLSLMHLCCVCAHTCLSTCMSVYLSGSDYLGPHKGQILVPDLKKSFPLSTHPFHPLYT